MNLAQLLTDSAAERADRPALKLDDATVTYAMLDDGSARVAALLRERGVQPGDRVGIMLPNVPYFAVVYYGVLRAGATVVPMNVLLKAREVNFYLSDPAAKVLFAWHEFAAPAEQGAKEAGAELILVEPGGFEQLLERHEPDRDVAGRDDSDTAVILYTSGTTGTPKGAELTHGNLLSNVRTNLEIHEFSAGDVTFGALPLFHSFGQTCALNTTIAAGGMLTLLPRFDPGKALEILQRDDVTLFQGVPTMFAAIVHHAGAEEADLSRLRACISGGIPMP